MKKKVIIVGAGSIGLHCAFFLNQAGLEVEVLDDHPNDDQSNCSYGNCGYITPSHFVPIASPYMLKAGFKMMFDPTSPVSIPLLKNLNKLPWYFKFILASRSGKVQEAAPTLYRLNEESRQLYELLYMTYDSDSELKHRGLLMAATTEKGFLEELELSKMAQSLGIITKVYQQSDMKKIEPFVDFNIAGAIHYKTDAHVHPQKHMHWLIRTLEQNGVAIRDGIKVDAITLSKGKIKAIRSGDKVFRADEYVIAGGAKSSVLAGLAGIKLPVIAGKGYSIDFKADSIRLDTPVILTEARVAITPFKDALRLGSGMEFNGETGQVRLRRVQAILNRTHKAIPLFPEADANQLDIWEGLRPLSPDGVPFIGRTQKLDNLLFATGHAMMGMSLGPVTGRIITDIITGAKPGFNMDHLNPDRFSF